MDAGRQTRKFPGYTTNELRAWIDSDPAMQAMTPALHASVLAEIANREAGSKAFAVPQL